MKKSKSVGGLQQEKHQAHIVELDEVQFLCPICQKNVVTRTCKQCQNVVCDTCTSCQHNLVPLEDSDVLKRISTRELHHDLFPSVEAEENITLKMSQFSKSPNDVILQRLHQYMKNIDGALKSLEKREEDIQNNKIGKRIEELESKLLFLISSRFETLKSNIQIQSQETIRKIDEEKQNLKQIQLKTIDYKEKAEKSSLELDMNVVEEIMSIDTDIPIKIDNLQTKEHHLMLEIQSEMFVLNNDIENLCYDLTKNYNIAKTKIMDKIYCLRNVKNFVQIYKCSEELISMNPKDYTAMAYKGEALLEIGRKKEADLIFEKIFKETEGSNDAEDEFAKGRAHFILKEYKEAARCFGNASNKNHTPAQFNLGWMYSHGISVPKNNILAAKLYYKAAQNGFANAQYNLGVLYYTGIGIEQNYEEAVNWYYKASKKGLAMAQSNLAVCFFEGIGTRLDRDQAIRLYIAAAGQGLTSAQFNLAYCYYQGSGVVKNFREAHKWFTKAALAGLSTAQYQLGKMYENGYGGDRDLTEAKYWYQKAASQNHSKASEHLKTLK